MRLPTGFSPGKNCCAASALMMTTGGAVSLSRSEKTRPFSSDEPTVWKRSGLIQQPSHAEGWFGSMGRSLKTIVAVLTRWAVCSRKLRRRLHPEHRPLH